MNLSKYTDHNGNSLAGTVDHLTERLGAHDLTFILVLVDKKTEDIHIASNVEQSAIPNALSALSKEITKRLAKRDPLHVSGESQ